MSATSEPLRMAMVGAGAIAELGHLPALSLTNKVVLAAVVNRDLGRARRVAKVFGAPIATDSTLGLAEHTDFACVAVPHHVHEAVSLALLDERLHLLIEKPLATTTAGCDQIIDAARSAGRRLGVAMPRRYSPAARFAKSALDASLLGPLHSFEIESGNSEVWQARSDYLLDPVKSGGGVLMANGCHDLDFVRWLLGPFEIIDFRTNSHLCMEADCILALRLVSGVEGMIELSRTRDLRNAMVVRGEKGVLTIDLVGDRVTLAVGRQVLVGLAGLTAAGGVQPFSFNRVMADQLEGFAAAIREEREPDIDGAAGREVVVLIEECYAHARPFEQSWRRSINLD